MHRVGFTPNGTEYKHMEQESFRHQSWLNGIMNVLRYCHNLWVSGHSRGYE